MSVARTARASDTSPSVTIAVGARKITITHADKVLFPEDGLTKGDLCHYYRDVAHWLLPYVAERPLTLQRWPNGLHGPSFFEKQAPRGMPEWIATTKQPSTGKRPFTTYPLCNDAPSLLWFANMASITLHVWMSRVSSIEAPDYLLFDLDPFTGCTVKALARVALTTREELESIGLAALVKTTGGKGLHLVVPLQPRHSYEQARAMTQLVGLRVQHLLPEIVTLERSKSKRAEGTVYFDWGQLGLGRTLVPPFAVRGRPGAPVSVPLEWSEVEELSGKRTTRPTEETFRQWNITTVPELLAERGDPWQTPFTRGQRLERALEKARATWS